MLLQTAPMGGLLVSVAPFSPPRRLFAFLKNFSSGCTKKNLKARIFSLQANQQLSLQVN